MCLVRNRGGTQDMSFALHRSEAEHHQLCAMTLKLIPSLSLRAAEKCIFDSKRNHFFQHNINGAKTVDTNYE